MAAKKQNRASLKKARRNASNGTAIKMGDRYPAHRQNLRSAIMVSGAFMVLRRVPHNDTAQKL